MAEPRLEAAINSDIEYRTYTDELLDDESVGTLDGRAALDLIDDRFFWDFLANLDQGQQDPFAARGPNTSETIKYVSTGTVLMFLSGERASWSARRAPRRAIVNRRIGQQQRRLSACAFTSS